MTARQLRTCSEFLPRFNARCGLCPHNQGLLGRAGHEAFPFLAILGRENSLRPFSGVDANAGRSAIQ